MNECDTAGCYFLLIKILIVILAWVLMAASDGAEIGFCEVPSLGWETLEERRLKTKTKLSSVLDTDTA